MESIRKKKEVLANLQNPPYPVLSGRKHPNLILSKLEAEQPSEDGLKCLL